MNTTRLISTLVLVALIAPCLSAQEYRGVNFSLSVSNDKGRVQHLVTGIREGATRGLDPMMEEAELPPLPPTEIFDARLMSTPGASQLGLGSWKDFRPVGSTGQTFTETFTVAYQAGEGSTGATLRWGLPLSGRITKIEVDGLDQTSKEEVRAPFSSGQVSIAVTFDYRPLSFRANPVSVALTARNIDSLPTTSFEIIPEGDTQASWTLTYSEDWLDVSPSAGEGRQTIQVALNRHTLPAGAYNATLRFRSEAYPASLDVPVTLTMIVGAEATPPVGSVAFVTNHPNPFRDGTTLMVALEEVAIRDPSTRLVVRDLLGRVVADLSSQLRREPGLQRIDFRSAGLSPGYYTCEVISSAARAARSLIIMK